MSLAGDSFDGGRRDGGMHQPPNPADLQRVPPGAPDCARVRGLLRDYSDGDLAEADVRFVDEHLQACRVCAVELARAEHEVLRLRRAVLPLRLVSSVPEGFARRVLERLVLEGGDVDAGVPSAPRADAASAASAGGTGRAAAARGADGAPRPSAIRRSARERSDASARERSGAIGSPAGILVAGLLLLFVLGVGVRLFAGQDPAPERVAMLFVETASDAFDGDSRPLRPGASVLDDGAIWLKKGGLAQLNLHDATLRAQPAASIELRGGELQMKGGAPLLVDGKVRVVTNRGVEVPIADGTSVMLGVGDYVISAEIPYDMLEDWNLEGLRPGEDGLPGLDGKPWEVRVEVNSGNPARILRAGAPPAIVAAGSVGSYSGGGPVAIGPVAPVQSVAREETAPPAQPVEVLASLSGHALGATGLPSVGAEVFLSWAQGDTIQHGVKVTASDGSFALQTGEPCESSFAIVLARPNAAQKQLGVPAPHAAPLSREGQVTRLHQPIRFAQSTAVRGAVRDDQQLPRSGVRVVPCIVDDLLGAVLALTGQTAVTDELGSYLLQRLPADLPQHQSLVLLLLHDDLEATVLPIPERGDVAAVENIGTAIAKRLRWVKLVGLTPLTTMTVYEEVPGLPPGAAAVRRLVNTTLFGHVGAASVGSGRMWVQRGAPNAPVLSELVYEPGTYGGLPRYRMQQEALPLYDVFRPLSPIAGSDASVAQTYRHQAFEVSRNAASASGRALLVVDALGYTLQHAEVFAVRRSGPRGALDARFLGFTSHTGASPIATVLPEEDVLVVSRDGAVGFVEQPTQLGFTVTAMVHAPGRVNLAPELRLGPEVADRVVTLRFTRQEDGMLPALPQTLVRFAREENGWEVGGLPPGTYQVTLSNGTITSVGDPDATFTVDVPAGGFVVLGS